MATFSIHSHMNKIQKKFDLSEEAIDRIIEMAWEDRTPFDAIQAQFGLKEQEVIELMRASLKRSSWERWRARVQGRKTKHLKLREEGVDTFKSASQRQITFNKISKKKY